MQASTVRKELIERIYAKCPERWPDVRCYKQPDALIQRMFVLRDRIRVYPMKKTGTHNAHYRRMIDEYRLLKAQLTVLSIQGPGDSDLEEVRDRIRTKMCLKDAESKHIYTLFLLHFIMAKYSEEQLTHMATGS